ncbi:MAG: hypothetical protein HC781_02560 [Leptolyngbyaceae cyanobacterium CSU_1_4]|nr:hypothetical protein [Leptolyngbyaceae cyanobacterium CSU_1_4]
MRYSRQGDRSFPHCINLVGSHHTVRVGGGFRLGSRERSSFAFEMKPFLAVERFAVAFSFSALIAIGRQFLLNDLGEGLDCPASLQPEDESSQNCYLIGGVAAKFVWHYS